MSRLNRLLTTQVGEMAMAAAAYNDIAAWILLALAVALAGARGSNNHSPLISVWVLLSGLGFVVFMFLIVRPMMNWVARKASCGNHIVEETYTCLTLSGVMVFGFMTDFIGIHSIFGAFIFGLTIPKDGDFAGKLISRIEYFVSGLLLPLYFASSGIKTDIFQIHGLGAWGLLVLVVSTACAGKILGTFMVGMLCTIPMREALTLGMLMNTKGLVELIVLNIGKEKKILDDEIFAILVIMALFATFITTPLVTAIYRPLHRFQSESAPTKAKEDHFSILACLRDPRNSQSLINLIESIRTKNKSAMTKLYVMRLLEYTDWSSSIMMVQKARKNGFPFIRRLRQGDQSSSDEVAAAFEAYSQLGRVLVRPTVAISSLNALHEDICHIAVKKRAEMIILPFHKHWQMEGDDQEVEIHAGHGWGMVNERVLGHAPCSVGVLVDRGLEACGFGGENAITPMKVCVFFFGGPDCRKALDLVTRMVEHPAVKVTIVRFIQRGNYVNEAEKELDEAKIAELRKTLDESALYVEKEGNLVEEVLSMGKSGEFELMMVGKGKFPQSIMAKLVEFQTEHSKLGPIGDLLASSDKGIKSSLLVIQENFGKKHLNTKLDGSPTIKTV